MLVRSQQAGSQEIQGGRRYTHRCERENGEGATDAILVSSLL